MPEITIRKADENDIAAILKIIASAKEYLKDCGVDQWQDDYPQRILFERDIAADQLYVAEKNGSTAGVCAVVFGAEPSYEKIYEGTWQSDLPYVTLHRFAVGKDFRRMGIGEALFAFGEKTGRSRGAGSLRADTHEDNAAMRALMTHSGLTYCGTIYIDELKRAAYEKVFVNQPLKDINQ